MGVRGRPFEPGNKYGKGRPPRKFSITNALIRYADVPESIDNDGNTITAADVAARWLWDCATGKVDAVGGRKLAFADRLDALNSIRGAIEGERGKHDPESNEGQDADEAIDPARLTEAELQTMTDLTSKMLVPADAE